MLTWSFTLAGNPLRYFLVSVVHQKSWAQNSLILLISCLFLLRIWEIVMSKIEKTLKELCDVWDFYVGHSDVKSRTIQQEKIKKVQIDDTITNGLGKIERLFEFSNGLCIGKNFDIE